ncbi:MAG: DMT family transporter [Ekhidna sp.]|nr:DMT family transporter [Ekhidna sp.]MBC6410995.1 DMT family transporter [Ekhidna sp.]MBC6425821.1 DMT family transporter [Ekhidna sp.]
MIRQEAKDYLLLHFIVLIWGFTAVLGLLITIPSVEVVFFRTLIAAAALIILLKIRKREISIKKRRDLLMILGTGTLIAAHWILFFMSARIANVSICLAGMATCSLWTSLLEPLSQGRKIKGFEVMLSIIAFIGIAVIFSAAFNYLTALLAAVLSAFIASIFTIINGRFTNHYNPYVITYYEMVGACSTVLLFYPFYAAYFTDKIVWIPSVSDWVYLVALAICCTVYAYAMSVELMKRLSAFSINLVVNLEPVYGIMLAWLIFGDKEEMNSGFYLGTGLILTSVLLYPILNRRHRKKALATDIIR